MEETRHEPAKRVDIVQMKLVREKSIMYKDRRIRSPKDAYDLISDFLGDVDREHFVCLCLSTKNEPTCLQVVRIGSLNASIVSMREVFKTPEDIGVTKRLVEAGGILGIDVLDHLIGTSHSFRSLKESGYM